MPSFQSTNQTRARERYSIVLDSLQVIPLDSEIHETIRKTTRASQVKPMTTQRNEPDSLEKKRGSHLKIPRNVGRTRTDGLFPNRYPICSRQCDNVRSFCHRLITLGWPSARSTPDSSLHAYSQSASRTLPDDSLDRLSPNRSNEPQRLSSGAMDHPTSYRSEPDTSLPNI